MPQTIKLVKPITHKDIVDYYDSCEIDYKWIWNLNDNSALHYGYWTEDTQDLGAALQNLNQLVMDQLDLIEGDHVLDAGCGIGGTSLFIGQRANINVHGITLSQKQVDRASENASSLGIDDRIRFSVQDYTNTSFTNESFDSVFAIESVCHASEKSDFLNEASRLLKQNGTLIVSGFFASHPKMNAKDEKLMTNWAHSWAVPSFEPLEHFIQKANNAGFTVNSNLDISDNIYRSALRLYRCFFPGLICHFGLRLVGVRNKRQEKNVWSAYYQYKSLMKKLWQYRVIKFKKSL